MPKVEIELKLEQPAQALNALSPNAAVRRPMGGWQRGRPSPRASHDIYKKMR